jgi:hypothetical protein
LGWCRFDQKGHKMPKFRSNARYRPQGRRSPATDAEICRPSAGPGAESVNRQIGKGMLSVLPLEGDGPQGSRNASLHRDRTRANGMIGFE